MRLPVLCGTIDRRLLINYRVDRVVLQRMLPAPFRPQLVGGFGLAGICLIRLRHVRPHRFSSLVGLRSENAAHRVAVEWDDAGKRRHGVYIVRRDTDSLLNVLAGGRLFPGIHHRAKFHVCETEGRFKIKMESADQKASLTVDARVADRWPGESVFDSLQDASAFFEAGSLGYSPSQAAGRFQGLELRCRTWQAAPLEVVAARSSWYDDESMFPPGSIELDSGLHMCQVEHEWHLQEDLCCRQANAGSLRLTPADAPVLCR
jgi:hypothetical protein